VGSLRAANTVSRDIIMASSSVMCAKRQPFG
jgi:hypothetical protein